jgi:3-deoxy-manno-octulosonate cytidylyltransferase (CMP-KDO synthetase)
MRIVGVIPARYGSQRLPAKPLVDLLGKPMVQRVYEQAKQSRLLHDIIVATDDERIARAVEAFGGKVMMTSPQLPTGSDRIAAVAEVVRGDIFVNIQGDEPLMHPAMIDLAIQILLDDTHAQIGTLVKKIESADELLNPNVVKVVCDGKMFALLFSRSVIPHVREQTDARRWLEHHTFYKHVGLYTYRREALRMFAQLPESSLERAEKLEQLRALEAGIKMKVALTEFETVPVDTEEDVGRVRTILAKTEHAAIE